MTTLSPLDDLLGERRSISVLRVLANVGGGLSGNEIARRIGAQQSSARKALERLVERGIVTRRDVGRSAAYELDERREVVRQVIRPLFRAEQAFEQHFLEAVADIVDALHPKPTAAIVYGSVARATSAPGDVDLLFVVPSKAVEEMLRDQLIDVSSTFEERYRLPISPVFLAEDELRARAKEPFIRNVLRDGILLYGRSVGLLRNVRRWQHGAGSST